MRCLKLLIGCLKIVIKCLKIILRFIERFERSWNRRLRFNFEIERFKRLELIFLMVVRRFYKIVRGCCEIVVMGWIIRRCFKYDGDVFDEGWERLKESFEVW